ncbi:hypothetical protein IG631_12968 [Alternaria alternata]|nr:hypothetical protein IG631_12968 [Alternaria alternata]
MSEWPNIRALYSPLPLADQPSFWVCGRFLLVSCILLSISSVWFAGRRSVELALLRAPCTETLKRSESICLESRGR